MPITRKALIIINPGEVGAENYCEGVKKDSGLYRSFMQSGPGGAWRSDEITTLSKPSPKEVRDNVTKLKSADYSVVVFCGHGYHSSARNSTILELRDGVELDSIELREGSTKRTLILDCCRQVHTTMALDEALKKSIAKADSVVDLTESRKCFDAGISACANGIVALFGCSVSESAGDDAQQGGVYSYNLISSARNWVRVQDVDTTTHYKLLSVVRAHDLAVPHVVRISGGTQNPTIQKPRTEKYFPFGVVA